VIVTQKGTEGALFDSDGEAAVIRRFVKRNDLVFDVGANVGGWSALVLQHHPDVTIHCFEPVPASNAVLSQKLSAEITAGKVTTNCAAMGRCCGSRSFTYYTGASSWSTFYKRAGIGEGPGGGEAVDITVPVTTIDSYCQSNGIDHIDFLKVDTEGGELDVLLGAQAMLQGGRIAYLQFEYGGTYLDAGITLRTVFDLLDSHRYGIFKILPDGTRYVPVFRDDLEDFQFANYLAVNERLLPTLLGLPPKMLNLRALLMKHKVAPRGVIHVGAHEGGELPQYLEMGVERVLYVEANPETFERLSAAVKDHPQVIAAECAIADHNGTVDLHVTSADQSSSILALKRHQEIYPGIVERKTVTVPCRTLDALLSELELDPAGYNILNIDIQGAELLAFRGGESTLRHIEAINSEINYDELYEGCPTVWELDAFLEDRGFDRVATVTPYHPSWGDGFYVKRPLVAMSSLGSNGRFGNQIFQYAFLRIHARQHHLSYQAPPWIGQQLFGHQDPPVTCRMPLFRETSNNIDQAVIPNSRESFRHHDLWGYFQYHTSFYAPYKEFFRSLFEPLPALKNALEVAHDRLRSLGKTVVGLHLRRGDYGAGYFFVAPTKWYLDWLDIIWPTLEEPVLFIASDEPDSVLAEFSAYRPVTCRNLGISFEGATCYPDFYLLSRCDHCAISNSSFSFAACMLNRRGTGFYRPTVSLQRLVPFDPWDSEVLLRDPASTTGAELPECQLPSAGTAGKSGSSEKQQDVPLPVHFFTIVLNGEPFIRGHIERFLKLPFTWHWHIVEGVADLKHDTAWCLRNGGRICDDLHGNGLSNDGTTEYLDELARCHPENVTLYRKPDGLFWDGKLEMVSALLGNVDQEALLWQVDVDEFWSPEQVTAARKMFQQDPSRTAAYYYCNFYVGRDLMISTRDTYGNHAEYEWLRTWRYLSGDRWASHAPPRLCRRNADGSWTDLAKVNPWRHAETEALGLVFDHYAYVEEKQLRFKEIYYGYRGAVQGWRRLQAVQNLPVPLREYFPWVKDGALVDAAPGRRHSGASGSGPIKNILFLRPDSIGDSVLAASMLPHLKSRYPEALITVFCQQHIAELYEASPLVHAVIGFDLLKASENEQYRATVLQRLQGVNADLLLNSLYSRAPLYDYFAVRSRARETVACQGDLSNSTAEQREQFNRAYQRVLPSDPKLRPELERHRHFLKSLGIATEPLEPLFWTTPADEDFASAFFAHHGLAPDRCIALFAGANSRHRIYAHYGTALAGICRDQSYTVLALGTAADHGLNQQNLDDCAAPSINLSGKLTLRQTAAILKRCRMAVGAETGTAHIACAVGTPNVVLVGGGHFGRFMPYSPLTSVVCLPLSCYFCNWSCSNEQALCVKALHPEVIAYAVRETLKGTPDRIRIFCEAESAWHPLTNEPRWQWRGELVANYPYQLIKVAVTAAGAAADAPELSFELLEGLPPLAQAATEEDADTVAGVTCETTGANTIRNERYLVSAIVSTYNAERFFRGCLEDLVNQTLYRKGTLEIIIIDSGSQQDEQRIAHDFISRYDHIFYERTGHETLYAAWNRGIDRARGRYITHANTDDRHRADAFEVMAGELDRHDVGLVYCDAYMTNRENETFEEHRPVKQWLLPDYNLRQGLIDCPFGCQVMWRKNIHRELGKFDPSFRCAGDYEFFLRVAMSRGAQHIAEIMTLYHESRSNLSFQIDEVIPEVQRFLPRLRRKIPLEQIYPFLTSDPSGTAKAAALVDFADYMMGVAGFIFVDFELAEDLYTDALALAPGQPDIIGNLVIAKVAREKRGEAFELLQQCQVQTPRLKHYLNLLKAGGAPGLAVAHLQYSGLRAMPPVKQLREILILLPSARPHAGATGSTVQAPAPQQQSVSAASVAGPSTAEKDHSGPRTGAARSYLVSAIVSTYNAERFLRGKLEDLEAQTISSELEIIVIDSGSQQNERGIVEEFQRRYDNIRCLRTERRETVYQAWNRGVRAARGEFITNANTDDRLRKDCLEILVRALRQRPDCVLAYGDMRITKDENGTFDSHEPYGYRDWPPFDRFSLLELCCIGPFPLWRRSLHDEIGCFDERYRSAADYEFWLRAALKHDFVHVPQFLGLYYLSPETVSRKGDLPNVEYLQVQHEYRPKYAELAPPALELTPEELREYEDILAASPEGSPDRLARLQRFAELHPRSAQAHHQLAEHYYKAGELGYARKYFEKAALLDLHSPLHTGMLHSFLKAELYQSLQHYNYPATAGDELERHLILGMICTVLERLDAARSCYLRALDIDPCDGAARANLVHLDGRLGLSSDAPSTVSAGLAEGGGGSAGYCHAV
jgi:FkbM family methyltransferase